MAEQTGALYKYFEGFEVGGLLARNVAPEHVNVDRTPKGVSLYLRRKTRRSRH
jgi:hypothetical protein